MKQYEKQRYRSISEIEEKFFPKSYEEKLLDRPLDPKSLGFFLANESINQIREELNKWTSHYLFSLNISQHRKLEKYGDSTIKISK